MTELRREMGFWDVVLFFVAAIVGLRWIATAAAAGPSALVVWGGALAAFFLPLAFTVITLQRRFPEEGGLYAWTKHAFGDFAGFMAGWMYWTSTVVYFPGLLYFSAGNALFIGDWQWLSASAPYFVLASLGGLAIALALNVVGLGVGKWLHNAGGLGTFVPMAILVVMGGVALVRFGPATPMTDLTPSVGLKDMIFWSTIAFGFGGFEAASFMSDEIHDARRTIPRAVIVAGVIIGAIYVLGTASVLLALPRGEVSGLQGIMQAISATADRIGWSMAGPIVAVLLTIGNLGGVGAWLASTARLPFVAGVDRALPPAFAQLHPRFGTPWVALVVQAVGAALFVVLGQAGSSVAAAYDILVSLGVISYFIPYLMMFGALIKLDRRPGARVIAAIGLGVTLFSIGLAAIPAEDAEDPTLAMVKVIGGSVFLLLAGALLWSRRRR
jgi:glutamate:GABA antiporter